MFLRKLNAWKDGGVDSREPVARFLRSYSIFIGDHTGKEDKFFDMIEEKGSLSAEENELSCRNDKSCSSSSEQDQHKV